MLLWEKATTFPTVMVRTHKTHRISNPVGPQGVKPLQENSEKNGKSRRLRSYGHEPRNRSRRPFIGIRRPYMERHGGDFEAEPHEYCHEPESSEQSPLVSRKHVEHYFEPRRSGGAVQKGDAVKEDGRGEGAQDEVLQGCFVRPPIFFEERHEHIDRQRHELEPRHRS